jgi:hypothetical protein
MANLFADGIEINIEDGHWRLFNVDGANSLSPFFDTLRGSGLVNYVPAFAESRGLPGTVLASDYVKATIVGFDENRKRWVIGLQVQMKEGEKPRFVPLVTWPVIEKDHDTHDVQHGTSAHQAGRVLAEYIGCPLKVFGSKKIPVAQPAGSTRSGVTGPLGEHRRSDLDAQRVRFKAEQVELPISMEGIWIGETRTTLNVRLAKSNDSTNKGIELPAYNQVVIDKSAAIVHMVPPTGLLGSLLGVQGRNINIGDIRNVEYRHTINHESVIQKDEDGMAVDVSQAIHIYGVYLTLADESLLLLQLIHVQKNVLASHRARTGISAASKGNYDADREIAFLRGQQQDQMANDAKASFADTAAIVIASALQKSLVRTEIGDQPL